MLPGQLPTLRHQPMQYWQHLLRQLCFMVMLRTVTPCISQPLGGLVVVSHIVICNLTFVSVSLLHSKACFRHRVSTGIIFSVLNIFLTRNQIKMADQFLAEIRIFPYDFAPSGWAFCSGQLLPLFQNTKLFALLGTNYGGNGQSNFALPNLQGAVPMFAAETEGNFAQGVGVAGGSETVTLLSTEIPVHNHSVRVSSEPGDVKSPAGNSVALSTGAQVFASGTTNTTMSARHLEPSGVGQPHNNLQPYLACNFCIALQGNFPSRP
jgi:microcystin-dependent protein